MKLLELIESEAHKLTAANVSFGHGTTNAFDESAWLVLWCLGFPLDTPLDQATDLPDSLVHKELAVDDIARVQALVGTRISARKPAAYLTGEAWLQGYAFHADERAIVPRSLIAELLVDGGLDFWLHESTHKVLDLCTGNGSLAVIAASVYPDMVVTAADLSADALAVAHINVDRHHLRERIALVHSDAMAAQELISQGPFDLILCNPPYVSAQSMRELPAEYLAEPEMALNGNYAGGADGMDFVRQLLRDAPQHMTHDAVLVLEIGNERPYFEAAFPALEVVWLETSAGEDQVLLITRESLTR